MADTNDTTEYMLTTVDNPFDPFTEFDEWLEYDMMMGYNTSAFLARVSRTSDELSEPDQALAIQHAIDEIVQENVSGMWRKVSRSSAKQFATQITYEPPSREQVGQVIVRIRLKLKKFIRTAPLPIGIMYNEYEIKI